MTWKRVAVFVAAVVFCCIALAGTLVWVNNYHDAQVRARRECRAEHLFQGC